MTKSDNLKCSFCIKFVDCIVIESIPYCAASHSHLLAIAVLVVLLQGIQANLLPSAQKPQDIFLAINSHCAKEFNI